MGGALLNITIFGNILSTAAKKGTDLARDLGKKLDNQIDRFNKKYVAGLGITLINNEIKDIMKVIKSLKNRGIILKENITKTPSQEG